MIREVTIWENNFLLIFSDAVLLYEAAVACENSDLNSALAKSSVLSVNYAIEAAANSFLKSIELTKTLRDKIDKFTTIEKFDFVLQWHTNHHLDAGDSDVQAVKNLIKNRNSYGPSEGHNKINAGGNRSTRGWHHQSHCGKARAQKGKDPKPKLLGNDPELYTHEECQGGAPGDDFVPKCIHTLVGHCNFKDFGKLFVSDLGWFH